MNKSIILNKNPKIEFHLFDDRFQLINEQKVENSGFYSYSELQSIELNNLWFPTLAKLLRVITWIFNGVPFFPDAKSYKKANIIIHLKKEKLGIWLTNSYMTKQATKVKLVLDNKIK